MAPFFPLPAESAGWLADCLVVGVRLPARHGRSHAWAAAASSAAWSCGERSLLCVGRTEHCSRAQRESPLQMMAHTRQKDAVATSDGSSSQLEACRLTVALSLYQGALFSFLFPIITLQQQQQQRVDAEVDTAIQLQQLPLPETNHVTRRRAAGAPTVLMFEVKIMTMASGK